MVSVWGFLHIPPVQKYEDDVAVPNLTMAGALPLERSVIFSAFAEMGKLCARYKPATFLIRIT